MRRGQCLFSSSVGDKQQKVPVANEHGSGLIATCETMTDTLTYCVLGKPAVVVWSMETFVLRRITANLVVEPGTKITGKTVLPLQDKDGRASWRT